MNAARPMAIHPVHAVLLAGTFTLFVGALLSDWAYWSTYHVQWNNFASWLIAAGLLLGGIALAFALVGLRHRARRSGLSLLYFLVLLATWLVGLFNAVIHAKDAYAVMPEGLVLSVIAAVLAGVATWIGFARPRTRDLS